MDEAYLHVTGYIGLTVDDTDEAFEWCRDVPGLAPVMASDTVSAGECEHLRASMS